MEPLEVSQSFYVKNDGIQLNKYRWMCSAETRPLHKLTIFEKWQLFQLFCDLNLEQHGRVLDAIFWVIIKDFCLFRPIIDKS